MEISRVYDRPRLVVVSNDAAESRASFSTTIYDMSPDQVQVVCDIGPASFVLYLKAGDMLALSKLFDDAAAALGG